MVTRCFRSPTPQSTPFQNGVEQRGKAGGVGRGSRGEGGGGRRGEEGGGEGWAQIAASWVTDGSVCAMPCGEFPLGCPPPTNQRGGGPPAKRKGGDGAPGGRTAMQAARRRLRKAPAPKRRRMNHVAKGAMVRSCMVTPIRRALPESQASSTTDRGAGPGGTTRIRRPGAGMPVSGHYTPPPKPTTTPPPPPNAIRAVSPQLGGTCLPHLPSRKTKTRGYHGANRARAREDSDRGHRRVDPTAGPGRKRSNWLLRSAAAAPPSCPFVPMARRTLRGGGHGEDMGGGTPCCLGDDGELPGEGGPRRIHGVRGRGNSCRLVGSPLSALSPLSPDP